MNINGKKYDWSDVTVIYPGSILEGVIGIESIDWDEERETEAHYGKGSRPNGYGTGNWKASGKMTISLEAYQQLNFLNKGGIFNMKPFNIVVSFANVEELPHTVELKGCKFTKKSNKASQGDKKISVDLDMLILEDVKHDGIPANGIGSNGI